MTETTISLVTTRKYFSYEEAKEHILSQGVKFLGWRNSGITVPTGNYELVYSNRSGSSCLYCDLARRVSYAVDMGD
jgi:hypothetical protein